MALIAAVLAVPAIAAATTMLAGSRRSEVERSLAAIERVPSIERLDVLSERQTAPILAAIAEDKTSSPKARLTALTALAGYPGQFSEDVLRRALVDFSTASTGISTLYARAAMRSLAVLLGPRVTADLVPQLIHPSPDMRAEAARSLVVANARDAVPELRRALLAEQSRLVRQALDEAIVTLTKPEP